MRTWGTILVEFFFIYSVWNAEGLPVQLNVVVGKDNLAFATKVECDRVRDTAQDYVKTHYPPTWRLELSQPCLEFKPQGRRPR